MPTALMETTIDKPADEVWETIREFAGLNWYPGIESSRQEGDLRVLKAEGFDLEIRERLVHHDDDQRTYTYAVAGLPRKHGLGPGRRKRHGPEHHDRPPPGHHHGPSD